MTGSVCRLTVVCMICIMLYHYLNTAKKKKEEEDEGRKRTLRCKSLFAFFFSRVGLLALAVFFDNHEQAMLLLLLLLLLLVVDHRHKRERERRRERAQQAVKKAERAFFLCSVSCVHPM